jgi:hypothetical protein
MAVGGVFLYLFYGSVRGIEAEMLFFAFLFSL